MSNLRNWFTHAHDQLVAAAGTRVAQGTSIIGSREEELAYLAFHKERFFEILCTLEEFAPNRSLRVLDIGTSHLTLLLRERYDHVTTLDGQNGWEQRVAPQSIKFLLHDLREDTFPFKQDSFDLIVASEVIEHVPYAPARFLAACHRVLATGGKLLLTTPNAASYYHRRDMALGKNPFPMPPAVEDATGSWHAREYTMAEVRTAFSGAGFRIMHSTYPWYWNQFPRHGVSARIKGGTVRGLLALLPSLRDAMLIVGVQRRR